jgi:hypothetical protein
MDGHEREKTIRGGDLVVGRSISERVTLIAVIIIISGTLGFTAYAERCDGLGCCGPLLSVAIWLVIVLVFVIVVVFFSISLLTFHPFYSIYSLKNDKSNVRTICIPVGGYQ